MSRGDAALCLSIAQFVVFRLQQIQITSEALFNTHEVRISWLYSSLDSVRSRKPSQDNAYNQEGSTLVGSRHEDAG